MKNNRLRHCLLLAVCCLLFTEKANSQELKCTVKVNGSAILTQQTTDVQVFTDMENAISDFMNNKRWTSDYFAQDERIDCNLLITFTKSPQQNVYQGSAQFQVIRPVYGAIYKTVEFAYTDRSFNVSFTPQDRQMIFSEQGFNNNITSILGFYALMAIGIDYDSYSKFGGSPYFQRALVVANLAANAGQQGWQQQEDQRNRYWLIENFTNQQLNPFREAFYNYHRLGLDNMANDAPNGRKLAYNLLTSVKELQTQKTNSAVILYGFFDAKNREIVNVFSEATKDEKDKIFTIVSSLDPPNTENYRRLVK